MEKISYINSNWVEGRGEELESLNPSNGQTLWKGKAASADQLMTALLEAGKAQELWADTSFEYRAQILEKYAFCLQAEAGELAHVISLSTGKPAWESQAEVNAMVGKIAISIEAYHNRCGRFSESGNYISSRLNFKPLGVVSVFGPFNFPGHLPNGHIVPALLAGNSVVFKPSEFTPLVAVKMLECFQKAGLPDNTLQIVQGKSDTGKALAQSGKINGLFFTGSSGTGKWLHKYFGGRPEVLLALEMGGNNPVVVWEKSDVKATALQLLNSCFITAGQRCTCARRLILPKSQIGNDILEELISLCKKLLIEGYPSEEEPFMGPVISNGAAEKARHFQNKLLRSGGECLLKMESKETGNLLTPGIIDVSHCPDVVDEELFAPLIQVWRVQHFEEAIQIANRTQYGLAASLFSDNPDLWEMFYRRVKAGVINWNRPTTGASSRQPFGGIGQSGNFRPSAYFAADYCAYPVASQMEEAGAPPPGIPKGLKA